MKSEFKYTPLVCVSINFNDPNETISTDLYGFFQANSIYTVPGGNVSGGGIFRGYFFEADAKRVREWLLERGLTEVS